ncbi:hypothetical protein PanWU01x14_370050 [Parasponia andersonii]|uniref:Uncharacterized protein n=1 Tax=Parasponia andersonii TaxID=3476 RepID=A0A2P5A4F7_PARAD|nr:hypothetical protein PanWU01x14_370050 [Parasponia andersonii]
MAQVISTKGKSEKEELRVLYFVFFIKTMVMSRFGMVMKYKSIAAKMDTILELVILITNLHKRVNVNLKLKVGKNRKPKKESEKQQDGTASGMA